MVLDTQTRPSRRHNLPAQLTSFVGREREVAEMRRLLGTARLLTLTGTGGVGKTRLALEVATELVVRYPDGVWLAELAPIGDPLLVPKAVASALGVQEQSGRPLIQTLLDYLQDRSLLLILDNCEHLIEACASLADHLLRACRGLRILAASREALGINGETPWRVPSLAVPGELSGASMNDLAASEAARLFVERATTLAPTFHITAANIEAVVQICRRLDGMPLAIELAAARIILLTPEQIAARLDDRFRLLTGGSRTALPRQQTLRATIDWSYGLLPDPEGTLLRRLAVFAGGWTLEAAEAMCTDPDDGRRTIDDREISGPSSVVHLLDVLDLLGHLVDKSLVLVDQGASGEVRYRLLETIRQYAREKLVEAGEAVDHRDRHLAWCRSVAERIDSKYMDMATTMVAIPPDDEHDNFRAALAWGLTEPGRADQALHLAGRLHWFWYLHGHFGEGLRWLEQALAAQETTSPEEEASLPARARALFAVGGLARHRDLRQAGAALEASAALYRQLGDARGACLALGSLGEVVSSQGNHVRAIALLEEALALSRDVGDVWREQANLYRLGKVVLFAGDYRRAEELLGQVQFYRQGSGSGMTEMRLGRAAYALGDSDRAITILEQGLAHSRQLGFRLSIGMGLQHLAIVLHAEGQDTRAAEALEEALAMRWEMGDPQTVAECLETAAGVAVASGRPEPAARLFGAAAATRTEIGAPILPLDEPIVEGDVAAARLALGEEAFAAAWVEGEATPIERAVSLGLSTLRSIRETASRHATPSSAARADPLTPRERDIAALVARGLTNRQIADELVISERTASTHVTNILTKLGFSSRAQVAVWAVEQGLAGSS